MPWIERQDLNLRPPAPQTGALKYVRDKVSPSASACKADALVKSCIGLQIRLLSQHPVPKAGVLKSVRDKLSPSASPVVKLVDPSDLKSSYSHTEG